MSETKPVTKDDTLIINIRDGPMDNIRLRWQNEKTGEKGSFIGKFVILIDGNPICEECGEPVEVQDGRLRATHLECASIVKPFCVRECDID